MASLGIIKVFFPALVAFIVGIFLTPPLSAFLYKNEMWKKKGGKKGLDGSEAKVFNSLHETKEVGTPKMGGVIVWLSTFLTALIFWLLPSIFSDQLYRSLDFVSRNQTWIPLMALVVASLIGLVDDYLEVKGEGDYFAGGLSLKKRILLVAFIALLCGLWFYVKLGVEMIGLPLEQSIYLGWLIIPLFIVVTVFIYSGGVIDGIDGLSGGIFASIFSAYAGIAYFQDQVNLAAFCAAIVGAILAFLWFNIPPARFYMSETGMMGLTVTLSIVAFMTDSLGDGYGLLVLPVIALPLIVTTFSNIIQVLSKKIRGKKVFLVAPIHHHFEALGWPGYKVTMRFWVVGVIFALLGLILALAG